MKYQKYELKPSTPSSNSLKIINIDVDKAWIIDQSNGIKNSLMSAKIVLYSYKKLDQKDVLMSPNIQINPSEN